jgi:hypothetical protein
MNVRVMQLTAAGLMLTACGGLATNSGRAVADVSNAMDASAGPSPDSGTDSGQGGGVPDAETYDAGDASLPGLERDAGGPPDAGLVDAGATPTEWPNALSRANSDAWLLANHDRLTLLKPRVLVLDVQRTDDSGNTGTPIDAFVTSLVGAFAEMSKPHGLTTGASAVLQYQVEAIVDLKDPAAQYPNLWPMGSASGFDIGEIFSPSFAPLLGFADPDVPGRFFGLCELFESGRINELWIAAGSGVRNIYENQSRLQKYDNNLRPLAGQFNTCTNGCFFDPKKRVNCKVSVRMQEISKWRGPGCGTHAAGHAFENLRSSLPYLAVNAQRFLNLDIAGLPLASRSQYDCDYTSSSCFAFPMPGTMTQGTDGKIPPFSVPWGGGCGNVHFAPNSAFQYDYNSKTPALNSCDDYGQGAGGQDKTAVYTADLVRVLDQKVNDCGGGWVTYWGQSFPGPGNRSRDDRGLPMKNWWPFLFY